MKIRETILEIFIFEMRLAYVRLSRIRWLHAFPGCFRGIRFSVTSLFIFSVHVARKRDRVSASRFRQEDTDDTSGRVYTFYQLTG